MTWRLVSDVRCRPRRAPPTCHDIAGLGLHLDLLKALASGKAGFWRGDVAPDCHPIEKKTAAGQWCSAHTRSWSLHSIQVHLWQGQELSLLHLPCQWIPQQQVTVWGHSTSFHFVPSPLYELVCTSAPCINFICTCSAQRRRKKCWFAQVPHVLISYVPVRPSDEGKINLNYNISPCALPPNSCSGRLSSCQ